MKVLMVGKIGLLEGSGGDKVQVLNTASELRKLGVDVTIKDTTDIDPQNYDLVHIFQLDWTPESNIYAVKTKVEEKPLVLSPIHHSVSELKKFEDEYAFDFRRISRFLFRDQFKRDTFKDFYRMFFDTRRLKPVAKSIVKGLKNMHAETLNLSDIILVQTKLEAEDIESTFGVEKPWVKIPNGVGEPFLNTSRYENKLQFENYILCVGRIEPRKNQLSVVKAVKKLREDHDLKLVFVGKKTNYKHFEYTYLFNKALEKNDWITHIEQVPYEQMPSYYHYAKVCVSASWFETTGLTSLEALFCGANAVASGDRAKEYLGSYVSYCRPDDIDTIAKAINKELINDKPNLPDAFKKEYTWETAAKKTLDVYNKLIKL